MVYLKRKYSFVLIKSIPSRTKIQIIHDPTNFKRNISTSLTVKMINHLIPTDKKTFITLIPIPFHKIQTKTKFDLITKTHRIKSITYHNWTKINQEKVIITSYHLENNQIKRNPNSNSHKIPNNSNNNNIL